MAVFNAYEIFEIAEQIERNGGAFYRGAAERTEDEDAKRFLLELAHMEDEHENYFNALKEKFSLKGDEEFPDLDNQTLAYLHSVADDNVFVSSRACAKQIAPDATVEEVIKTAIEFEKDTVVFFASIKSLVPDDLGKEKIDALVKEEIGHIGMLLQRLKHYQ